MRLKICGGIGSQFNLRRRETTLTVTSSEIAVSASPADFAVTSNAATVTSPPQIRPDDAQVEPVRGNKIAVHRASPVFRYKREVGKKAVVPRCQSDIRNPGGKERHGAVILGAIARNNFRSGVRME